MAVGAIAASVGCSGRGSIEELSDDSGSPTTDGGIHREDAGDDAAVDREDLDASLENDGGNPGDSSVADASQLDSGTDAQVTDDGSAPDAGPSLNVIYASFNGMLVRIDPDTGTSVEVGQVRNAANEAQTYSDLVLTWTGNGGTAWMVTSYYQTPTLATLDLCTGLATLGPAIARSNPNNLVVEGLATGSDGTLYVASGNPASVSSPISNHLGTLNVTTGLITDLSATTIDAYQDDCDGLFLRVGTLYGYDVATANNLLDLYSLNLTTGAATRLLNPYPTYGGTTTVPLRIAWDDSRNKAFSWRDSDNNLLGFDMSNGVATAIGPTHASGSYGNQPSPGFFVAPMPDCDR